MNSWMLLCGMVILAACCASSPAEPYQLPPQSLMDLIDAPPSPAVELSPDREWMLLIERNELPSIADIARRMLRLAGIRIDPLANGRFRTTFYAGLSLRKRGHDVDASVDRIPLPKGGRLAGVRWAHDSQSFAFTVVTADGTELWAGQVDRPQDPRRLTERLNTVLADYQWLPDAQALVAVLVPADRGNEPAAPAAPFGANIQETSGNTSPTRTYQDLLTNPYDEALFEHYATGQVAVLGLDGTVQVISSPALIEQVEPSPDGQHLLVTTIEKPFSYLQTVRSFPHRIEVWDTSGQVEHLVARIPLAENIPIEGVRTGPRQVRWTSGDNATLVWFEALDGGDPRREAAHRDQLFRHTHPFAGEPKAALKVEHRAWGVSFLRDPNQILTYEYDRDKRWVRCLLHEVADSAGNQPKVLMDRSIRDRYGDPGRIVSEPNERGFPVAKQHGPWIYRIGSGATAEGMLPFLDRQHLQTLETERLWRCASGCYEQPLVVLDPEPDSQLAFVTQHQSTNQPPNYFLRQIDEDGRTALTQFPDPTPQIRGIKKQLVKYQRSDGVDLSATLYTPADHQPGQQLPLIVWAYPIEFNDADTAGQVGSSPWLFTRIRSSSHLAMVTQGYAIMDGATIPIIGDPETMNDTFVEQLVASAGAAIDQAVEMGVADRSRVAVGGHSYGAFMAANLLAHCDLFKAGVARSGAYNRTLTPFGFQSERRPLWEAKGVYFNISPFMHADKIRAPLLLIHGEEDNNSGTFPMQSQRLFQAIKGNGGTARLVMLPEESHGYRARESVLHVQAETLKWLDKYVKEAEATPAAESAGTADTAPP